MKVEKHLSIIYSKVKEKRYTKKDQLMLFFLYTFYHKRSEAYLRIHLNGNVKNRMKDILHQLERHNQQVPPKFKNGDAVYLFVEDHEHRQYTIHSVHLLPDKKIGYTYMNEYKEESNYIYPESAFVRRNIGRLEVDDTSFSQFMMDLKAKDKSWTE